MVAKLEWMLNNLDHGDGDERRDRTSCIVKKRTRVEE